MESFISTPAAIVIATTESCRSLEAQTLLAEQALQANFGFQPIAAVCSLVSEDKSATFRTEYLHTTTAFRRQQAPIPEIRSSAPPFVPFPQISSLMDLLQNLRKSNSLSIGLVKRSVKKAMVNLSCCLPAKPHAFHVEEMLIPAMFQGGGSPLSPGDRPLDVNAMDLFHIAACSVCSVAGKVVFSCYWSQMRKPILEGWAPPIDIYNIQPLYSATGADGNHKSATVFHATVQKEVDAQVAAGICTAFPTAPSNVLISPLGAVIKNSDIAKSLVLTGISIVDQQSLDAANMSLIQQGLPKIKLRSIQDATAGGINAALYTLIVSWASWTYLVTFTNFL